MRAKLKFIAGFITGVVIVLILHRDKLMLLLQELK